MSDIIESYYEVARDLERQAAQLAGMAAHLFKCADQMSEEQMKRKDAEGKTVTNQEK